METEISHEHVMKVNFKWKIENFNQVCNGKTSRDKIVSPAFSMGLNDEFTWCLQLYPKGIITSHRSYMSVYLVLVSSPESKVKADFKISILSSKMKLPCAKPAENCTFSKGERHGYKQFVKTLYLKNLENDELILKAAITVRNSKTNSNKIKMIAYLKDLFENKSHSDAVLTVEKKDFKIHKCILASRSPYFASLFQHDMIEKEKNTVEVKDVSPVVMDEILRFAYTGDVQNLNIIAKDLLAAANKFLFEDLKNICEAELFNNLTVDNVVELLSFAEMHNAVKLQEQALDFCVENINQISEMTNFKEEMIHHPQLQQELICKLAKHQEKLLRT